MASVDIDDWCFSLLCLAVLATSSTVTLTCTDVFVHDIVQADSRLRTSHQHSGHHWLYGHARRLLLARY